MKLLVYIWRNVTRNKLRSGLTILSVGFSLALMTILYGYLAMQKVAEREAEKYDRVIVLNKLGFAAPLPIAHVDKVRRMDAISCATPFAWYGGNYQNKQALFAQFAVDPRVRIRRFQRVHDRRRSTCGIQEQSSCLCCR